VVSLLSLGDYSSYDICYFWIKFSQLAFMGGGLKQPGLSWSVWTSTFQNDAAGFYIAPSQHGQCLLSDPARCRRLKRIGASKLVAVVRVAILLLKIANLINEYNR